AYEALVLSRRAYGDAGGTGLQVAMARRADAALAGMTPRQQALARRILLRLVQFGAGRAGTRPQEPVAGLRTVARGPDGLEPLLQHLARHRLLTLRGQEGGADRQVDLAHEALIEGWPTLRRWVTERRDAEQARRRLKAKADEWVRLGRGAGGLLDAAELP